MSYQYTYLVLDLFFLAVCLSLFFWRKDVRKEMMWTSLIFGVVGFTTEFVYRHDWWRPLTITKTAVGIEDFLYGAIVGSIAAVIYEEVFKKRIRLRRGGKDKKVLWRFLATFGGCVIVFFGSFYLLHLNTFYGSILTCLFGISIIYASRPDLILDSLFSGLLVSAVAFAVYFAVEKITPGWVDAFWLFKNVPHIIIFNVPIDDIVFYFLFGALLGPLYEYWQEGRLVNIS